MITLFEILHHSIFYLFKAWALLIVAGAAAHTSDLDCWFYMLTTKHHQVSSVFVSDLNYLLEILLWIGKYLF